LRGCVDRLADQPPLLFTSMHPLSSGAHVSPSSRVSNTCSSTKTVLGSFHPRWALWVNVDASAVAQFIRGALFCTETRPTRIAPAYYLIGTSNSVSSNEIGCCRPCMPLFPVLRISLVRFLSSEVRARIDGPLSRETSLFPSSSSLD
jgi:hypothetical protein